MFLFFVILYIFEVMKICGSEWLGEIVCVFFFWGGEGLGEWRGERCFFVFV